ncbi:hypothetical protein [Hymenobacter psychrotolerans]|uniref:Uncharacterized protein n=1 Tax=Hymenobacter psychrotolerans DSM 18569 TaxID=1121959 RepID=A0A1M7BU53_9BACT|nr:hypothetical protein [Hymenobacter psychrotolerans]SHL58545.1 hypothetical protein SAMN02746009_03007 [Hymenobacter psychrotolerans DSM 18569]
MPTSSDNLEIKLTDADLKKINDALDALDAALAPVLITLTGKEIQRLPKASDASLPFIEKALDLAEQQPQFAPGYVDIPGLRLDLVAWQQLQRVARRLQPLASNLASTSIKLGSESYVTALAYYSSVQQAAKQGVSGAQDARDTLKTRFEQSTAQKAAKATPKQ